MFRIVHVHGTCSYLQHVFDKLLTIAGKLGNEVSAYLLLILNFLDCHLQTKDQIKALKAQKARAAAEAEAAAKESAEQRRKHDVSACQLTTALSI